MTATMMAETTTEEWWHDGRNVTFLAQWTADWQNPGGDAFNAAQRIVGIYETPWLYLDLWHACWVWVIESLSNDQ